MFGVQPIGTLLGMMAVLLLTSCGEVRPPLVGGGPYGEFSAADREHARQLITDYGCVACHMVPGVKGPATKVGPPLENLAFRGYIGGILPNTPENLVQWLLDPPAADPRTAMPDMGLSHEEAKIIAAYLLVID